MRIRSSLTGALVGLAAATSANEAAALSLTLDYRYDSSGFFSISTAEGLARRGILESSASVFEGLFTDVLAAIAPTGGNQFYARVNRPDSGAQVELVNFDVPFDEVFVFVGARDLGSGVLAVTSMGSYTAVGSDSFLDTVEARGQPGALLNQPTDFGPWGGSITFSSNPAVSWYVDSDASTSESFSGYDLFSVALHEMAHLLGFGTSESWKGWRNGASFGGAETVAVRGSAVPLSGDGAHWAESSSGSIFGTQVLQEAAMDPTITSGTRKLLTELDVAALVDTGWTLNVQQVPLPASLLLFGSAVLGLTPLSLQRRAASRSAT